MKKEWRFYFFCLPLNSGIINTIHNTENKQNRSLVTIANNSKERSL